MNQSLGLGKKKRADSPTKKKWRDNAQEGRQQRGDANLEHLRHGGMQADFKEEQHHAQFAEHSEDDIFAKKPEGVDPQERQIPEQDANTELAKHFGLS
jgi:hypothetical protein